jgi:hypothetical protein
MSLDSFKASRDTSKMKVVVAVNTENLDEELGDDLEAEMDKLEKAMDGTKDPNYDPNKGLHYLQESRRDAPITSATYEFSDGRLKAVLVAYGSQEQAQAAARKIMNSEPNAGNKWIIEGSDGSPTLRVFVFEHKLVVGDNAIYNDP